MSAPDAPTAISIHPKPEKNILLWSNVANTTQYNIYWIKEKVPNCYFNTLNDWTLVPSDHCTIVSSNGTMKFDLDEGYDETSNTYYDYTLYNQNFVITIDIPTYTPHDITNGLFYYFQIQSVNTLDRASLQYTAHGVGGGTKVIRSRLRVNGVDESDIIDDTLTHRVTKMRFERSGNTFENSIYVDGSWSAINSYNFESRASNVTRIRVYVADKDNHGGIVEYDNLIITPSVKDAGTKITDVTSPYDHINLDSGDEYIYVITAENDDGESDESLEFTETPVDDEPNKMGILNDTGDFSFNSYSLNFYYESHEEIDFNNDSYYRSTDATLKTYQTKQKKRHLLTFKNMANSDRATLLTLYNLRDPLYFYQKASGAGIKVRWLGALNLIPMNKSKSLYLRLWEGSILLEEM